MIKNYYRKAKNWFLSLSPKKRLTVTVLLIGVVFIVGFNLFKKSTEVIVEASSDIRVVEVLSAGALGTNSAPLALFGDVKSRSEANIKTEASGRVAHVYKKIGDQVSAGEIIADIENSRELASIAQAQALLAQAMASQNISQISQGSTSDFLKEARNNAVNSLRSTYDGIEDAIRNKIDPMFVNPQKEHPEFIFTSSNSQLSNDINLGRAKLQAILVAEQNRRSVLSADNDLLAEIKLTESELFEVKKFVDMLNAILTIGIPTQSAPQALLDANKLVATGVRTSWTGIMAGLSGTKDNLTAKTAQAEIAQKQGSSTMGAVTTSEAGVAQAESVVSLAKVALEKTIIRSPIFGTINSLPITQGDFVSPFQPAATVSNNGALEVVAYVSDSDSRAIAVGNTVKIKSTAEGVVTRIAPALDPLTKKIEVRIGVSKGLESLLNGESVNLTITRSKDVVKTGTKNDAPISIPIVSLKITPDGPVVFTVEGGVLKQHFVKVGALLGDRIVIMSGLSASMEIVTDARGLKDLQKVQVK